MSIRILVLASNYSIFAQLVTTLKTEYDFFYAANQQQAELLLVTGRFDLLVAEMQQSRLEILPFCKLIKSGIGHCQPASVLLLVLPALLVEIDPNLADLDLCLEANIHSEMLGLHIFRLLQARRDRKLGGTRHLFIENLHRSITERLADQNLNSDELAALMELSRPSFYRKVKSVSLATPKQLIDLIRIQTAVRLILQTELKLAEIAKLVGYSNSSVFCRNFQKHFNISPSKFMFAIKSSDEPFVATR